MFTRLRVKDVCVHGLTGNVFLIHVFFLAAYAKVIFRPDLFCCSCLGDRVWWHTVPLELCQSHSDNMCTPGGGLCVMGSNRFLHTTSTWYVPEHTSSSPHTGHTAAAEGHVHVASRVCSCRSFCQDTCCIEPGEIILTL